MTARIVGPRDWRMTRNQDGHREYRLKHVVEVDPADGPWTAINAPGLPLPGTSWDFDDDSDPWAICEQTADVTPTLTNEPNTQFIVEQTFSTRSPNRCQDATIEDPLLEPPKISGGGTNRSIEATHSRFGAPILTSSFEQIRGPQNEWDEGLGVVKIEQNIATAYLGYILPTLFQNCVNAFPLWGCGARCIKLSPPQWEQRYHGQCSIYYKRGLEFLINPATWDRNLLDEGSKALNGHFDRATGNYVLDRIAGEYPNRWNPQDFTRFTDRNGNQTRVVLNGAGLPAGVRVTGWTNVIPPSAMSNSYSPAPLIDASISASGAAQTAGLLAFNTASALDSFGESLVPGITTAAASAHAAALLGVTYRTAAARAGSVPTVANATAANDAASAFFFAAVEAAIDTAALVTSTSPLPAEDIARMGARSEEEAGASYNTSFSALAYVLLNESIPGTGTSTTSDITTPGYRHVEKYHEVDFLLLGIPTTF